MRSSGTPLLRSTSTAMRAEPPVTSRKPESAEFWLRHTCSQHRIKQQDPSILDVLRQLVVEQPRLARLLVSLNENLAYPDTPAALPQGLLHRLAGSHDRDSTDLALELDAIVCLTHRRGDGMLLYGQVVETFLDKQADDSIGVEDEVGAVGVLVADHATC